MNKTFESFEQLASSGFLFRITDNRGETIDRMTVLFSDGDAIAMNEAGYGFSQWAHEIDPAVLQEWVESGEQVDLGSDDLSDGSKAHILARVNEAFNDFYEQLAAAECPRSRKEVENKGTINDGTYDCAGDGIFWDGHFFWIATEDEESGPFVTPGEAIRASLPDEYSLSGPEYHGPHFPTRPVVTAEPQSI